MQLLFEIQIKHYQIELLGQHMKKKMIENSLKWVSQASGTYDWQEPKHRHTRFVHQSVRVDFIIEMKMC